MSRILATWTLTGLLLTAAILSACGTLGVAGSSNQPGDQLNWNAVASTENGRLSSIIWDGERYIGVSVTGKVWRSEDGHEWVLRTREQLAQLEDVAYSGSRYVAVGSEMFSSTSSRRWDRNLATQTRDLNAVIWSGTSFVAVGKGGKILRSSDGLTWVNDGAVTAEELFDVHWSGSQFIAVGARGVILLSANGIDWNVARSAADNQADLYGVASGPASYTAVGKSGAVLTSEQGADWAAGSSRTNNSLIDVIWFDDEWVAVGLDGTIRVSSDGISWTAQNVTPAVDLWTVNGEYQGRLIAAGAEGTVVARDVAAEEST